VGDLEFPSGTYFVLVFLQVDSGVALSADYWSMWAHTITGLVLDLGTRGLVRPLEPAIACAFVQDAPASPYLPDQAVRSCLSQPARAGRHSLCYGFWCRTVLANPVFGDVVQDPDEGPIPVRYRCTFDGPGGSPVPGQAPATVLSTLPLITIDEAVVGLDDPMAYTLRTKLWNPVAPPPPNDTVTPPPNVPTMYGVDVAYPSDVATNTGTSVPRRRRMAQCFSGKEMVLHRLPAGSGPRDFGTHLDGPDKELRGRPTFAGRYLSPHINGLTDGEALDLFVLGLPVCSILQLGRTFGRGFDDAVKGFTAAERVGQPPYTPVYFAVDISVDDPRWPDSPSLQQVVDYYHEVRRGYRQYVNDGGKPYYIGAYAAAKVLDAVYRAGLATHFWQPWPPSWGPPVPMPADWRDIAPGWRAWPHLNAWQVLLGLNSDQPNMLADNADILSCLPANDLDLDVAWGDPGSWIPQ
jgi:hypothetical protein